MADSSHVDSNVITTATDASGTATISVVQSNVIESTSVESVVITGGKGETGATGATGATGESPITVSSTAPSSPTVNQLWVDISA